MTNEGTLEPEESIASAAHAAAVTTTKVVKGTLWTLIGQAAPLTASFVCTPILIRLLGSESYGVYVLISLIPVYLQIADIGMGMASTKFGSEAFGSGERVREAELVRTAAVITLCASTPVGLALVLFAPSVAQLLNVPIALQNVAVVCIRIASVTFVLNLLNNVLNTPQLSRLRMDLNSLVVAIPRMVGILLTPLIL
ncbi:MAG: lipopolysaccharide biosynthesis protein, partial [Pyrinomonadaceae bacterium]